MEHERKQSGLPAKRSRPLVWKVLPPWGSARKAAWRRYEAGTQNEGSLTQWKKPFRRLKRWVTRRMQVLRVSWEGSCGCVCGTEAAVSNFGWGVTVSSKREHVVESRCGVIHVHFFFGVPALKTPLGRPAQPKMWESGDQRAGRVARWFSPCPLSSVWCSPSCHLQSVTTRRQLHVSCCPYFQSEVACRGELFLLEFRLTICVQLPEHSIRMCLDMMRGQTLGLRKKIDTKRWTTGRLRHQLFRSFIWTIAEFKLSDLPTADTAASSAFLFNRRNAVEALSYTIGTKRWRRNTFVKGGALVDEFFVEWEVEANTVARFSVK